MGRVARSADSDNVFTVHYLIRITEFGGSKSAGVNFQDSKVAYLVTRDKNSVILFAVRGVNLEFRSADFGVNMVIGDNVTVFGIKHSACL